MSHSYPNSFRAPQLGGFGVSQGGESLRRGAQWLSVLGFPALLHLCSEEVEGVGALRLGFESFEMACDLV